MGIVGGGEGLVCFSTAVIKLTKKHLGTYHLTEFGRTLVVSLGIKFFFF